MALHAVRRFWQWHSFASCRTSGLAGGFFYTRCEIGGMMRHLKQHVQNP